MTASPEVLELLRASGLPWEFVSGSKHIHIRIAGRLAGILPRGGHPRTSDVGRARLNQMAQLRRLIREVQGTGTCSQAPRNAPIAG